MATTHFKAHAMFAANSSLSLVLAAAGLCLFLVACLYDLAWRLVPNAIPVAIAATGLGARLAAADLAYGLLAGFIVFLTAVLCWRRGWLGGADVKLLGAGALLMPPSSAFGFVLATCLAGGVLALAYVAIGQITAPPSPVRPNSRLARILRVEQRRLRRRGPLPYAAAIAAGAGFVLIGA